MILVIPEIVLSDGKCISLIDGIISENEFYSELSNTPEKLCLFIRNENARSIFIVDKDSLESKDNKLNIQSIKASAAATEIPIIVYSNFENIESCEDLLKSGIYRIIIDEPSVFNQIDLKELIHEYTSSRVAFLYDLRDNYNFTDKENLKPEMLEYFNYLKSFGASRVVLSCRNWRLDNIDLKNCLWISDNTNSNNKALKISLWGEIKNSQELLSLKSFESSNIDSIILGKSLFENRFSCQQLWRMIEPEFDKYIIKQN